MKKYCRSCRDFLPDNCFHPSQLKNTGISAQCIKCCRDRYTDYYHNNRGWLLKKNSERMAKLKVEINNRNKVHGNTKVVKKVVPIICDVDQIVLEF